MSLSNSLCLDYLSKQCSLTQSFQALPKNTPLTKNYSIFFEQVKITLSKQTLEVLGQDYILIHEIKELWQ